MSILIGILTTVLVLNCLFLVLLILIQLPKKESGSDLAFGGGTPDAAPVRAEVIDKVDDALAGAADTPAPTTPEAATPAATPGKPAEIPAAPPEGGAKK